MDGGRGAGVLEAVLDVCLPVADALAELRGVDEVEFVFPEPGAFEVVDFEGAVGWDPGL